MQGSHKPPLAYEELRDIIDLCLWAGQLLLQHGATSRQVETGVHLLGTSLGCDWLDVIVAPDAITISVISGPEFRTKVRRVISASVDFAMVAAISALPERVASGELERLSLRAELRQISDAPGHYNRWLVVVLVGLACAGFSRLFGGDWSTFAITWAAASLAMMVRQELHRQVFNPLIMTTVTALAAGLIAGAGGLLRLDAEPQIAVASAVLLLVPGVPLVNSAADLINGYLTIGIARGFSGLLIVLCIALGLLLAAAVTGVQGL
jgi:uncharacterized membrane protein YjjP (DUF1212 family)